MSNNRTQYDLVLNGKVEGEGSIAALAARIDDLARAGGEAAPEFAKLASEIRALATQNARIESLDTAISQAKEAYSQLGAARDNVDQLNRAMSDAKAAGATAQAIGFLEQELSKANLAADRAEKSFARQKAALDNARQSARSAGIDTANLGREQQRVSFEFAKATGAALNAANGLDKVSAEAGQAAADISRAGREADKAGAGFANMGQSAASIGPNLKSMAGGLAALVGANEILGAITGFETLDRSLKALTGSEAAAAREMEYLKRVSNLMGVEVLQAGNAFVSLMASTQGTALEGEQTRQIFEAIAGSMAALGKSGAETERALQAVSQMASKGTVSMEELRGQLGEALPGALRLAAEGMGVTVEALVKMVGEGGVLAEDLLPKLAEQLKLQYGAGEQAAVGLQANWARLKNAISETADQLGDSGITAFFRELTAVGATALTFTSEGIDALGKKMGVLAAALVTGNFDDVADSLNRITTEAREGIAEVAQHSDVLGQFIAKTGDAADAAGESAAKAGATVTKATDDIRASIAFLDEDLRKLNGDDLETFGEKAREAFTAGKISAEKLADVVDRQVREAVSRLGLDAGEVLDGLSADFTKAVASLKIVASNFDALGDSGRNAGAILEAAIGGALRAAQNPVELERLRSIIQGMAKDGRLAKDAAADLLDTIREKSAAATPGINSVAEAFRKLGVTSTASLKEAAAEAKSAYETIKASGKATAADLQAAFVAYLEKVVQANGGVVDSTLRSEAALRGLELAADGAGGAIAIALDGARGKASALAGELQRVEQTADRISSIDWRGAPDLSGDVPQSSPGVVMGRQGSAPVGTAGVIEWRDTPDLSPNGGVRDRVLREVSTSSIDNRRLAIRAGLTDPDQIDRFSEIFADVLQVNRHAAFQKFRTTSVGGVIEAKRFQVAMAGATSAAIREAAQIAKREAGGNSKTSTSSTPSRTVRVQLSGLGRTVNVDTVTEGDAERLVDELQRLGMRS